MSPRRGAAPALAIAVLARALTHSPAPARAQTVPIELAPIAARVRAGDETGALAALRALPEPARADPAARYLEGRLAERTGDLRGAIDAYAAAVPPLPEALVRDATSRRARLLARSGRCGEAEPLLAALDRDDPIDRAIRAECALVRGEFAQAESLLARAAAEGARDVDSFALRFALAEAQARAGASDRAIATLRALYVEHPEHPDAERAREALEALAGAALELQPEERLARAARLDAQRRHDEAVRELAPLGRPRDPELLRRVLHLRGMALFHSRHAYAEAARVLQEAALLGGATWVESAFHAARALSRSGDDRGAIRAYRRLVRTAENHPRAAEAEYLAAWLELRLGRRAGRIAMERFLAGPRAARVPNLAREARWWLALSAFRAGEYRRASELFAAYAREDADPMVRGRGTYWQARALALAGDREGALAGYRATIRAAPLHWYALLARERLLEAGADPGAPLPEVPRQDPGPPPTLELPPAAAVLRALGLDRNARAEARAQERALLARGGLRALVALYLDIGEYGRAHRLVAGHEALSRPALAGERWAWEAAYPRAFESEVRAAADAQRVPPELLWAIMRQESAYDPDAVSYADAIGLLQVLPSTARRIARALGVPFRRELLFDPAWNTRLGAAEIGPLLERYGLPLCLASYNAGAARVDEWLMRSGDIDLDLFVEDIPFEQTRNYVRRVTSHYARYLHLREPEAGWPAFRLPLRVTPRR
jgi:soluble lytic murein transglycosylase